MEQNLVSGCTVGPPKRYFCHLTKRVLHNIFYYDTVYLFKMSMIIHGNQYTPPSSFITSSSLKQYEKTSSQFTQ